MIRIAELLKDADWLRSPRVDKAKQMLEIESKVALLFCFFLFFPLCACLCFCLARLLMNELEGGRH